MAHETNRANAPGLSWKFTCQTFSESRTTLSSSSNEPIIGSDARQVSARKASHFGWCPSDSCFSGMLITTMALCIGECLQKRSVFGVRSDCGLLIHGSAVSSILCVTCPNRRSRCLSLNLPISKSVVRLNATDPAWPNTFQSPCARCIAAAGLGSQWVHQQQCRHR